MPESVHTTCPYCGEPIELLVDASAGSSSYIEDCQVCCRPIQVDIEAAGDQLEVHVKTGDD